MHELSIAQNLVEIASEAAQNADATRVEAVHLRLGLLSGVVKDALLFSYDIVTKDTLLEGSRLDIEELPVIVYCQQCQTESTLPNIQQFRCLRCDTPTAQIVQGRELEITSLEISNDD